MAEGAFTQGMLDAADPAMQQLLAWHAAEEIEHKAVAFDVLQQIDPSYALRIAGLVYATVMLGGFWLWGAIDAAPPGGLDAARRRCASMRAMQRSTIRSSAACSCAASASTFVATSIRATTPTSTSRRRGSPRVV